MKTENLCIHSLYTLIRITCSTVTKTFGIFIGVVLFYQHIKWEKKDGSKLLWHLIYTLLTYLLSHEVVE